MTTQLVITSGSGAAALVRLTDDKDTRSRFGQFVTWLADRRWLDVDLAAYRDHLLDAGKSPVTTSAQLSSVRSVYRRALRDNTLRDRMFDEAGAALRDVGQRDTPANRKAFVDEQYTRLSNSLDPKSAKVEGLIKSQDKSDSSQIRLTRSQAEALLRAPGVVPIEALRDTAAIALMLCTGVREAELCALEVEDLRQKLGGELALHVRKGKGCKARLIPYGDLVWVLAIVDKWLQVAKIKDGFVLRSFWKMGKAGDRKLRGRLSVRAIENIVAKYPIVSEGGAPVMVRCHDLRRTYARSLYEAGVDLVAISQNLGHANTQTTLRYIGALGIDKRRAPAVYSFDLKQLSKADKKK
jgi:integrase